MVVTQEDVHIFVHRAHVMSVIRSHRENLRLQQGDYVEVVHTPMEWLPPTMLQKGLDKLGHVQSRFYGDIAAEFVNCLLHSRRKFDGKYGCAYRLCPGIPPMFVDPAGYIEDARLPQESHAHEDNMTQCVGEFHVIGWAQPGGRLGVTWADHDGLTCLAVGETYPTPMFTD
jgi:hypothetical protein